MKNHGQPRNPEDPQPDPTSRERSAAGRYHTRALSWGEP
jgi:hypothetical protein